MTANLLNNDLRFCILLVSISDSNKLWELTRCNLKAAACKKKTKNDAVK